MSLPSVYFESTIPSYLVAKASRDHVLRGQQEATRRWWDEKRAEFSCHVSAFVEIEIVRGHPDAAEKRLKSIAGIPRLASSPEVMHLAERILASGLIPTQSRNGRVTYRGRHCSRHGTVTHMELHTHSQRVYSQEDFPHLRSGRL